MTVAGCASCHGMTTVQHIDALLGSPGPELRVEVQWQLTPPRVLLQPSSLQVEGCLPWVCQSQTIVHFMFMSDMNLLHLSGI